MLYPCSVFILKWYCSSPTRRYRGNGIIWIKVKVNYRIRNEAKHKYRSKHNCYCKDNLRHCTRYVTTPTHSFQPILEFAGRALPEIAAPICWIRMPPLDDRGVSKFL